MPLDAHTPEALYIYVGRPPPPQKNRPVACRIWEPTEDFFEISEFRLTTDHRDADALYAFKSRGFGREVGVVTTNNLLAP